MGNKYNKLISSFTAGIEEITDPIFDEIQNEIREQLKKLYIEGKIKLCDDFSLQHAGLEFRVEKLLQNMGLDVSPGRDANLEDFIISPCNYFSIQSPLVVEVKSGKDQYVHRKHLRQLDDWVFELSGEDKARRGDITLNECSRAEWCMGEPVLTPKPYEHPTPHKGVLIYNGPIGVKFSDRNDNCINPNDELFVNKRFFCIIPFHLLVSYANEHVDPETFWEKVHHTSGLLNQI
jgi:hypothetical protein